jgi:hypothetical protein
MRRPFLQNRGTRKRLRPFAPHWALAQALALQTTPLEASSRLDRHNSFAYSSIRLSCISRPVVVEVARRALRIVNSGLRAVFQAALLAIITKTLVNIH